MLVKSGLFSDDEIRAVVRWWRSAQKLDEPLDQFLSRRGILLRQSVSEIEHNENCCESVSSILGLFAPRGIELLRRSVQGSRSAEEKTPAPASDPPKPHVSDTKHMSERDDDTVAMPPSFEPEPPKTQPLSQIPIIRPKQADRFATRYSPESLVGMDLGPYRLNNYIGRGPRGLVFEAEDMQSHRQVAVKVLAPEIASRGPAWRERFIEEAHLPAKIDSPLVLESLSVGQDLGMAYFAMPFMKYGSTREMFRSTRPFEPLEATRIARKAAQALAAIHAKGCSHGNLKPSNIFMDDNGDFRVADFFIPQTPSRPTEAGSGVPDVATDIRLLGATYHWLLTGKNPRDVSSRSLSFTSRQAIPDVCLRIVESAAPRKAPPVYRSANELEAALAEAEAAVQGLAPGAVGAQMKRGGSGASLGDLIGMPPSGQPRAVEIGQVLGGKYLITELIGQGSSGIVYAARHQTLNIPIAVKMLRLHGDSNVYAQLKTEACLLAQLNHPHIVRVWDFEDDPEMPYLVMEYVEGKSLGQLIKEHGPMRPERAVQVVGQIADGLAAAFQLGIVHRDVKPGNVLLTKDGMIKLADLGLAVFVNGDGGSPVGNGLAGTVAYMPPEQSLSAGVVDHRSDIYALGASFYHLLTGQIPFQGATRMEVILKHAKEPLTPPDELVSGVPQEISQVIVRMMAKSVNDRYQTYDELLQDLLGLDEGLSRPPGNGGSGAAARPEAGNKSGRFTRSGLFRVPRPG